MGSGDGRVTKSMKEFDSFINETNLRDPNLCNLEFTWSKGTSRSRIDRFLFTTGWEDMHISETRSADKNCFGSLSNNS